MIFGSGTPNGQKLGEKRDVKGLIKALGYKKNSNVRRDAAKPLVSSAIAGQWSR